DSHSSSSSSTDYIISGDTNSYSQTVEDTPYTGSSTDSSSSTGSTGATINSQDNATLYACSDYIEDKLGNVEPAVIPGSPIFFFQMTYPHRRTKRQFTQK